MTLSTKVKQEIAKTNFEGNELAFLCGVIVSAATLSISGGQIYFTISLDGTEVTNKVKKLIKKMYPGMELAVFDAQKKCKLECRGSAVNDILFDCGILSYTPSGLKNFNLVGDSHLVIEPEGKIAYLAGSFIGAGSVSVASLNKSSSYHIEWAMTSENQAYNIQSLLSSQDIFAKKVQRGEYYVVYIKEAENVANIVAMLGATNSYLQIENNMVERQMRNLVNRQSNCISANIDKSVSASAKQQECIKIIESTIGLNSLPKSLRQTAIDRKNNKEATLTELAELSGVTKSAINLRLRKICQIAKELGGTND